MFVKVCGLSTPESIREAVDAGADAVGFVLTASPRVVSPAHVAELLSHVPDGVAAVGVFRSRTGCRRRGHRACGRSGVDPATRRAHPGRRQNRARRRHEGHPRSRHGCCPGGFRELGRRTAARGRGRSRVRGELGLRFHARTRASTGGTGCSPEGWIPQTSRRQPGRPRRGALTFLPASNSPAASRTWQRSARSSLPPRPNPRDAPNSGLIQGKPRGTADVPGSRMVR